MPTGKIQLGAATVTSSPIAFARPMYDSTSQPAYLKKPSIPRFEARLTASHGRGAERVARRQHHAEPVFLETLGELADGGGLAGAIDADHQDHVRLASLVDGQELLTGLNQFEQFGLHSGQYLPRFGDDPV